MEKQIWPQKVVARNEASVLKDNRFCFLWKSESDRFDKAILDELETNFKLVDIYITEVNGESHFKYIYNLKKTEQQLTNFIVYDLGTHISDRTRPHTFF